LTLGAYESPQDGNIGVSATLSQNAGAYAYGLSLDVSRLQGINLGFSLSFGAIRNPSSGKWMTSAQSEATTGAVLIRIFLDKNGTGHPGHGNTPLPDIAVFVNDSPFARVTASDGTLLVDGLKAYFPADIRISESTLENPLLICGIPGLRINPRPGNIQTIDLPVVATAEVAGTVTIKEDKTLRAATGVLVEVIDHAGKVLQHQRTAYDGYYTLSRVPVGTFTVRATAYGVTASKRIIVPPDGAYLDGIDLTLVPLPGN